MKRLTNLKELSAQLGLSQTTVSRALNGFPEVSEKTRKRVQQAAEEFNYRPSTSAATLATGRSKCIAHVVPVTEHRMINPHFSDFLAGASETYSAAGFDLLIRVAQPEDEAEIYRDFAARRRVEGVIIHGPRVDDVRIEMLRAIGLPFVVHGRWEGGGETYSFLDVDNQKAFFDATSYLFDLGHTRIGLVNGLERMTFANMRRRGYERAFEARGIAVDESALFSSDMTEPYGYHATGSLMRSANPPTAILYASILPALGGLRALSELGLKPVQDVSLMTYDDRLSFMLSDAPEKEEPFFTSMQSSIKDAGKKAAEILLDRINCKRGGGGAEIIQEVWEADLVVGKTTGPPPHR